MTPDRLRRIEELYHATLKREPGEREIFLAAACHGDSELRKEVESLLEQQSSSLLDAPALEQAPSLVGRHGLEPGTQLGPYRVTGAIGSGGMGEVYKARDTRLGRDVAIKVLPEHLAKDTQARARFEREAKAVAALNHSHICSLYDVGPDYLVMELVQGPTLADRIAGGLIPLEEAVAIAQQIAEALEAAHEKGIIHRDLKPANVKITPEGNVKVLDFGLAKAIASEELNGDSASSTVTNPTGAGTVMGTAAYMAPEQAIGKPVDKRADIWSFGVVFCEMLTGRRLFAGESAAQTMAEVLRAPIDLDRLPRDTPTAIRQLLQRCLDRDPKSRLRDIGEARVAIAKAFHPVEVSTPPAKAGRPFAWTAAASILSLSLALLAFIHFRETAPERQHFRFEINPPEGLLESFRLSPDGKFLAIITEEASKNRIWIRSIGRLDTQLLTDINEGNDVAWSPDGKYIGFLSGNKFYKIARSGGPPVFWGDSPPVPTGGVWLDGGVKIITAIGGLYRFPAFDGPAVRMSDHSSFGPAWLPGEQFLYSRADGIFVGSLDGGKPKRILPDRTTAQYVPPPNRGSLGHLLFVRTKTLLAQPFDRTKNELRGDPISVAENIRDFPATFGGAFSASSNGVLVFRQGNFNVVLTWLDRSGKTVQSFSKPFMAANPVIKLSPTDSQAIVTVDGPDGPDLWIADFDRNTFSRFTFEGARDESGLWSPDGRKVLWTDGSKYYITSADRSGANEPLYEMPTSCVGGCLYDWSQDGKLISFGGQNVISPTNTNIWTVAMEGDRKPVPYRQSYFDEYPGQISPDSRWMAYTSGESGQFQVYVESIPAGKKRWQISTEDGGWPIWRHDGKELFYQQGTKLMAVPIRLAETSVEIGKPQALFDVLPDTRFQVSRDGQRILIAMPVEGASRPLIVDTDWRAGLKQ